MCEGTSDQPLADIVEVLFAERGRALRLTTPDFDQLRKVKRDARSKLIAGAQLMGAPFDLAVIHRDADNAGWQARREEIAQAISSSDIECESIPVIPIRMTEAWLLLDERQIREVAGNPNGRTVIPMPKVHEIEEIADPKEVLKDFLLTAASARGRRRNTVSTRFPQHRRQLLERLDLHGAVVGLSSWQRLVSDIESCIDLLNLPRYGLSEETSDIAEFGRF